MSSWSQIKLQIRITHATLRHYSVKKTSKREALIQFIEILKVDSSMILSVLFSVAKILENRFYMKCMSSLWGKRDGIFFWFYQTCEEVVEWTQENYSNKSGPRFKMFRNIKHIKIMPVKKYLWLIAVLTIFFYFIMLYRCIVSVCTLYADAWCVIFWWKCLYVTLKKQASFVHLEPIRLNDLT